MKLGRNSLLSMCALVAPASAWAAPVTVNFWHTMNAEESRTLETIVAEFKKANPDINVNTQVVPFSDAQTKIKVASGAGDNPDVFRSEIAWTPELAALGYLEPIDTMVSKEDLADYMAAPLAYNQFQGKLYGIPQVTDALGLLYNKRMFKEAKVEAPKTMDEMLAVAKTLTKADKGIYGLAFNPAGYWSLPFIWSFGGGLIDSKTRKVEINNAGAIKGLEFMTALVHTHKVVNPKLDPQNGYPNMMTAFKQGQAAMLINGPWCTADVLGGPEFKDPSNLGIIPVPKGPAGYGSPTGGHNYVLFKNTKHKAEAFKFMTFINQAKYQGMLAKANNLLPTRKSAYNLPDVKSNPIVTAFRAQIEVANNRPVIPEGGQIFTSLDPNVQKVLLQQETAEKALGRVAKDWNKLLGNKGK